MLAGVWRIQGWLFMNDARFWQRAELVAYLAGVPQERMILLDLFTEVFPVWKRNGSSGYLLCRYTSANADAGGATDLAKPTPIQQRRWVWNMLHSFGGNSGMYGRMHVIAKDPIEAKKESATMEGVGMCV